VIARFLYKSVSCDGTLGTGTCSGTTCAARLFASGRVALGAIRSAALPQAGGPVLFSAALAAPRRSVDRG
jgi:hypothetical protein